MNFHCLHLQGDVGAGQNFNFRESHCVPVGGKSSKKSNRSTRGKSTESLFLFGRIYRRCAIVIFYHSGGKQSVKHSVRAYICIQIRMVLCTNGDDKSEALYEVTPQIVSLRVKTVQLFENNIKESKKSLFYLVNSACGDFYEYGFDNEGFLMTYLRLKFLVVFN